jgi:hypothetical protein
MTRSIDTVTTNPSETNAWSSRVVRNTLGLAIWTIAWVASMALAAFGPGLLWNDQPEPTLLAIAFGVVVGARMLLANKRYLLALDELQRAIQLEAMAWSLGAGLVGGTAWTLLARHDLMAFEAQIGHLLAFMAVAYLVGCLAGLRRYR